MKIEELKHKNLIRLCKKFGADEPTKLALILKSKKQHASQLLLGKSSTGPATIKKLCKAWGIDEFEFIQRDDLTKNNFMRGWPEDAIEYCQKLKNVLEKGEENGITTIKEMIDIYTDKCKTKKTRKKGAL